MPKAPPVITMLNGLITSELSIVPGGANAKRFAILKESDMPFQEVLQKVLATKAEGEDELVSTLKAAGRSEEDIEVAVASYRMQNGFKDKVSKETLVSVAKAAGYELETVSKDPGDNPRPNPDPEIPDATPQIQAVLKGYKDALQTATNQLESQGKEIAGLKRDGVRKELVADFKGKFSHVPNTTPEKMADVIMKAREMGDEETEKSLMETWASVEKSLSESDLLRDLGARVNADGGGSAETPLEKLQVIAKEFRTEDPSLSEEAAFAKAMDANPKLYAAHRQNHLATRGAVAVG